MQGRLSLFSHRNRLRFCIALFCVELLVACTTTTAPRNSKPNDSCMCGPIEGFNDRPYCAIWSPNVRTDKPQPTIKAVPLATCLPPDCSRLFSDFCQKIQMAPPVAAVGKPEQGCYCDSILMENDKGQVQLFCAAWVEGAHHVIEYYSLESCPPKRCLEEPFAKAPKLCKRNFRSFYPPLLDRR